MYKLNLSDLDKVVGVINKTILDYEEWARTDRNELDREFAKSKADEYENLRSLFLQVQYDLSFGGKKSVTIECTEE